MEQKHDINRSKDSNHPASQKANQMAKKAPQQSGAPKSYHPDDPSNPNHPLHHHVKSVKVTHAPVQSNVLPPQHHGAQAEEPTMNFEGLKEASLALIEELGNGKDHILVTSDNPSLDFKYKVKLTQKGIIFIKSSEFSKKKFSLNFEKNSLSINDVKDNNSGDIFLSNFKQLVEDLESDKAILE